MDPTYIHDSHVTSSKAQALAKPGSGSNKPIDIPSSSEDDSNGEFQQVEGPATNPDAFNEDQSMDVSANSNDHQEVGDHKMQDKDNESSASSDNKVSKDQASDNASHHSSFAASESSSEVDARNAAAGLAKAKANAAMLAKEISSRPSRPLEEPYPL